MATEALYWDTSRGLHEYSGSSLYWLKVHKKDWSTEEQVAYCLQVGAGHCGEHAVVYYSVIVDAMKTDPNIKSKVQRIVLSGNASIDHAFCIVGMKVNTIWHDVRTKDWGKRKSLRKKRRTVGAFGSKRRREHRKAERIRHGRIPRRPSTSHGSIAAEEDTGFPRVHALRVIPSAVPTCGNGDEIDC